MNKLTETLPDGYVVGIQPSNMSDDEWKTAVLNSLAAYENTGLSPKEISDWTLVDQQYKIPCVIEAIEKQIAAKVEDNGFCFTCPRCKKHFVSEKVNYCEDCGQKFKW